MSWRDDLKLYVPDTLLIVEIVQRFLQDYFGHDAESSQLVLTRFFEMKKRWIDEEYVREEHSWRIATEDQFLVVVKGDSGELPEWRRNEGLVSTPRKALEYLRLHYWDREGA